MSQADVTKFRARRIVTYDNFATLTPMGPPVDGAEVAGGSQPHFQMSPTATAGMATTGFIFFFKAPSVLPSVALGSGFVVTVWVRDPNTFRWAAMMPTPDVRYDQVWLCADVDAMDGIYFQLTNVDTVAPGSNLDIHFAEQ